MKNFKPNLWKSFSLTLIITISLAFYLPQISPEYITLTSDDCPSIENWENQESINFHIPPTLEGDDLIQMIDEIPCEGLNTLFEQPFDFENTIETNQEFNSFNPNQYQEWSESFQNYWNELENDEQQLQEGFEIAKEYFSFREQEELEEEELNWEAFSEASPIKAPLERIERLPNNILTPKSRPAKDVNRYRIKRDGSVEFIPREINPSTSAPKPRNPNQSLKQLFPGYYGQKNLYWPPPPTQTTDVMQGDIQPVVFFVGNKDNPRWPSDQKSRFRKIFKDGTQHWLKGAKRRNLPLHFKNLKEHDIDMSSFQSDPSQWTAQELTYTCLVESGLWKKYFTKVPKFSELKKRNESHMIFDIQMMANQVRIEFKTDWAYFIFAVYTGNNISPKLTAANGGRFGAYVPMLNTSAFYMNFTWWAFGINEYVIPHEIGHVFGAMDHYREDIPCDFSCGYFNIPTTIQYDKPPHLRTPNCGKYHSDIMDGWFRNKFVIIDQTLDQVGMKPLDKNPPKIEAAVSKVFEIKGNKRTLYLYEVAYHAEIGVPVPNNNQSQFSNKKNSRISKNHLTQIQYQDENGQYKNAPVAQFTYHRNRSMNAQKQYGVLILGQWDRPIGKRKFKVRDARGKETMVELKGSYTGNPLTSNEWQPGDRKKS